MLVTSVLGALTCLLPYANGADMHTANSDFGSFSLLSLSLTDTVYTPLLYRQREELLRNRTVQIRHGSHLRQFTPGSPLDVTAPIHDTDTRSISELMEQIGLVGYIIVQNGSVRAEEYRHGNLPSSRNDIQSVSKSLFTTVLAIAHEEGRISYDDHVSKHIPELRDSAWADVSLLALVNMVSGVAERLTPVQPSIFTELYPSSDPNTVLDWLKTCDKLAEPWARFHYYNVNYYMAALSLSRALGETLESYMSRKLWEPMGAQYDAYARTTGAGQVDGHGGVSATLSDMARLGSFILDNLNGEGGPQVPAGWFESLSQGANSTGIRAPGVNYDVPGFGYQNGWWVPKRGEDTYQLGDDGTFAAFGQFGQTIYIIPNLQTIIATQSAAAPHFANLFIENSKFARAVALALKDE